MVGLMVTSSKRAMPYAGLLHPVTQQQATADLYLHRRYSNTVLSQSLWEYKVHILVKYDFIVHLL